MEKHGKKKRGMGHGELSDRVDKSVGKRFVQPRYRGILEDPVGGRDSIAFQRHPVASAKARLESRSTYIPGSEKRWFGGRGLSETTPYAARWNLKANFFSVSHITPCSLAFYCIAASRRDHRYPTQTAVKFHQASSSYLWLPSPPSYIDTRVLPQDRTSRPTRSLRDKPRRQIILKACQKFRGLSRASIFICNAIETEYF